MIRGMFIIICMCIVMIGKTGCEQRIRPSVVEGITADEMPDQESWDSKIIVSKDGLITVIIRAGYIVIYDDKMLTLLDNGVHVYFYNEEGVITSTLVSDRGEVNDATNDLSGYGNVVIESEDGTVLESEEIHWTNETERIHTDVFVRITSPDEIIQGYGMESDANLSNYTIYRVTGQTRIE
jgi:LPS export ABC transporter protein LptC